MANEVVMYPTIYDDVLHIVTVDIELMEYLDDFEHALIVRFEYEMDLEINHDEEARIAELTQRVKDTLNDYGEYLFMGFVRGADALDIFFALKEDEQLDEMFNTLMTYADDVIIKIAGADEYYYSFLFPNEFEQQMVVNQEKIAELITEGDALDTARDVLFLTCFENSESAHAFAYQFSEEAYEVHIHLNEDGDIHVTLTINMIPDIVTIHDITIRMMEEAIENDGMFVYWDTELIVDEDIDSQLLN